MSDQATPPPAGEAEDKPAAEQKRTVPPKPVEPPSDPQAVMEAVQKCHEALKGLTKQDKHRAMNSLRVVYAER